MKKSHKILEFDKIISKLSDELILLSNKKKIFENFILFNNLEEVNYNLDCTSEAASIILRIGRFPLLFTSEVNFLIDKTTKDGILHPTELLEIYKFLDTTKMILHFEDNLTDMKIAKDHFVDFSNQLIITNNLHKRIKEIINISGEILDSASSDIKQLRRNIEHLKKDIATKLNEFINRNISKLTINTITIRNDRYCIAVKNDFKHQFKGIIHDTSASGETVFIEPMIISQLNNSLNQKEEDLNKEIQKVLKEVSSLIKEESPVLLVNYQIIEQLDLIFAKASLSIKLKGNRVNVNNSGIVELLNCYHPLLEVDNIVSNNILIGKDYQGIIITGPNTGGKTVLLKTIGLLSLMVKAGILIPCEIGSNINLFDEVYADIGDEQSISQNLSTFSSHLKNVISIMDNVTNNSLVLLDELGSGTDPLEGAALAISIFDYLLSKKCLIIATSHYAELKVHAYQSSNIINASVEFNIETLRPTYKLLIGVPGDSNALKISKVLGLKDEIIDKATNYAYNNHNELGTILNKLTNQSLILENKLKEINDNKIILENKLLEVDKIIESTIYEKNEILRKSELEAAKILEDKVLKATKLIEELDEMKNKEIKAHELANKKFELKNVKEEIEIDEIKINQHKEIELNSKVFIEAYNAYGTVIKINKNRYTVSVGNTTLTLKKEQLQLTLKDVYTGITSKKSATPIQPRKTVLNRLDLRGMRYEEAEPLIDDYLSDASLAGLNVVTIIHGFGTGVIRELVINKLRKNTLVDSFRFGGQNEGGLGVTVVTLK